MIKLVEYKGAKLEPGTVKFLLQYLFLSWQKIQFFHWLNIWPGCWMHLRDVVWNWISILPDMVNSSSILQWADNGKDNHLIGWIFCSDVRDLKAESSWLHWRVVTVYLCGVSSHASIRVEKSNKSLWANHACSSWVDRPCNPSWRSWSCPVCNVNFSGGCNVVPVEMGLQIWKIFAWLEDFGPWKGVVWAALSRGDKEQGNKNAK